MQHKIPLKTHTPSTKYDWLTLENQLILFFPHIPCWTNLDFQKTRSSNGLFDSSVEILYATYFGWLGVCPSLFDSSELNRVFYSIVMKSHFFFNSKIPNHHGYSVPRDNKHSLTRFHCWAPLVSRERSFASLCICTIYLKCISNLFWSIKNA